MQKEIRAHTTFDMAIRQPRQGFVGHRILAATLHGGMTNWACLLVLLLTAWPAACHARMLHQQQLSYIPTKVADGVQVAVQQVAQVTTLMQQQYVSVVPASTSSYQQSQVPITVQNSIAPENKPGQSGVNQPQHTEHDSSKQDGNAYSNDAVHDQALQTVLLMHNELRAKHQVGKLSWSAQLQASAQSWADRCVFQHSGPGENLAQYFNDFQSAVQAWFAEEKDYTWNGQFSYATGHFTQAIWKATTEIGCGYAPSCSLYVCHYSPAGNVIGQFNENVFPPAS